MFVIEAAILFIPSYLWKIAEGGLMHKICDNLGNNFRLSISKQTYLSIFCCRV